MQQSSPCRYNPWRDLADNWPDVHVSIEPLPGALLGQVQPGARRIVLRSGTSTAQRRCTLAHEIVHLERGLDCIGTDPDPSEELAVHRAAARRLIGVDLLIDAVRQAGEDERPLAAELQVDRFTLRVRLAALTSAERAALRAALRGHPAF
ncbi:MAG: ImmA/IrrE family metallo-endopeptidase [Jatrophihabitans sp.]